MNAMKSMEGHTVKYLHSDSQSWMSLPELPIEYFSRRILTRIGNKVGKTVRVDEHTARKTRGKFARISVEMNLNKPLVPKVQLD